MATHKEGVQDLLDLHKKLAIRYKEYETVDGEIPPVVVLNEMRYALRACVKLLNLASFTHLEGQELADFQTSLQEANHALRNAYHDLVDGLLIQISRLMDRLLDDYPAATVSVLSEKRMEILADINEVERSVAESRGDGAKRKQLYELEIYEQWFAKLLTHYKYVDQVALTEIIREDQRLAAAALSEKRKHHLNIGLTLLGITVTVVVALFAA